MFCLKWKTTQLTVNPFEVARDFQHPQFQCRFSWPTHWLPAQIYFARNLRENLKTFSLKLSLLRLLLETKDFGQEFQLNCCIYTNKDNPLNEMLDNLFRWKLYENPLGNVIYTPSPLVESLLWNSVVAPITLIRDITPLFPGRSHYITEFLTDFSAKGLEKNINLI